MGGKQSFSITGLAAVDNTPQISDSCCAQAMPALPCLSNEEEASDIIKLCQESCKEKVAGDCECKKWDIQSMRLCTARMSGSKSDWFSHGVKGIGLGIKTICQKLNGAM